jgi:hypothetical protein
MKGSLQINSLEGFKSINTTLHGCRIILLHDAVYNVEMGI